MKHLSVALISITIAQPLLAATEAELLRCRSIAADAARLACYDTLFGRPGAATAPLAAAAAGTAAPQPSTAAVSSFGLPSPAPELDEITSHIPGRFEGWEPNGRLKLANGQVWQVTDGSRGVYWLDNPKVRITRGILGSFFLEIEGQNQTPRVRRVQ